jgi:hypothetical protein
MVRRPTRCRWLNPFEAHFGQIERMDKRIDHANRVALVYEIIKAFGQLAISFPIDESVFVRVGIRLSVCQLLSVCPKSS